MKTTRLDSLDVMRGLTIALMITVNNPGSWEYVYAPLRHSVWNGCTPTDLVFPFFLFIVGVSMSYSFAKFRNVLDTRVLKKITKRVVVIFLLGFLLNIFPFFDLENARIMGVLQRIALAYGLAALLCIRLDRKQLPLVLAVILLAYWGLLFLAGTHGMYTLDGNYPRLLDLKILGENHLYKGFGTPFDPEGLLGTLPAAGTVIMGYLTGGLLIKGVHAAVKKMVFLGLGALILGLIWHTTFPINKPLWTSSYVLYTGGFALLTLAGLCWLIDIKGYKKWGRPFIHFGTNPLFIYVFSGLYIETILHLNIAKGADGHTISAYQYLYETIFVPIAGNLNGSLLFALFHIVVFWAITYGMYQKRIFIKI